MRGGLGSALLAGAVLTGCGPGTTMEVLPAPSGWEETLRADRRDKDRLYAESADSPLLPADRASFRGLAYWDPDPAYRVVGHVTRYPSPPRFTIVTTNGVERPCEKVGWLSFDVRGRRGVLQVYRLLDIDREAGDEGLFLPFKDATTGRDTYPAGRYVDLDGPEGGPYVLDFNRAYNPLCAYGDAERYRCPATPAENRLDFPIEAGERGWRREEGRRAG